MAQAPQTPSPDQPVPPQPELVGKLLARRPYLMAFIVSMVREFNLAEQIFRDLVMHVSESRESHDAGQDCDQWLLALVRRRTMAFLQARSTSGHAQPPTELIDQLETALRALMASPEERWVRRKEALRACLQELPAHLARVVDLRYLRGLSVPSLAQALGKEQREAAELIEQARVLLARGVTRRLEGLA